MTRQRSLILLPLQRWDSFTQFAPFWMGFCWSMTSWLFHCMDLKKSKSNRRSFMKRSSCLQLCGRTVVVSEVVRMITKSSTNSQVFSDLSRKSSSLKEVSSTTIIGALKKTSGSHGSTRSPTMNTLTNPSITRSSSQPFTPHVSDIYWISISSESTQSYLSEVQVQARPRSLKTISHQPEPIKSPTRLSTSRHSPMLLHFKEISNPCSTRSQVEHMVLP